jgi:large subunit ribosomal protein L18
MKGKLTKKIRGTSERPRLAVFRSLTYIYAQVIDDEKGITLAAASSASGKKGKKGKSSNNIESAKKVGTDIAKKSIEAGVKKVVFDRSGYVYHGRIAALADAARAAGLDF